MAKDIALTKTAPLTPSADQSGCTLTICCPNWFDKRETYAPNNPAPHADELVFSGDDLNFLARVVYAEASGSASVKDSDTRLKEKLAIINVMYNRLNVVGFDPNSWTKGKFTTFRGVASAVRRLSNGGLSGTQFESVVGTDGSGTAKFKSSSAQNVEQLNKANCHDFDECFTAIRQFLTTGPRQDLAFDNFRAAGSSKPPTGQQVIGRNRFWKMK
jgi:hypothetical protein